MLVLVLIGRFGCIQIVMYIYVYHIQYYKYIVFSTNLELTICKKILLKLNIMLFLLSVVEIKCYY